MLPTFHTPRFLLNHPEHRSDLFTFRPYPDVEYLESDSVKVYGERKNGGFQVSATFFHEYYFVETGKTDIDRFARMLAKIAHSYTVAELGLGNFIPTLTHVLHKDSTFPPDHVIGGELLVPPPSTERFELSLSSVKSRNREFWVVRIRLFGDLGFPVYLCVSGVDPSGGPNFPQKMLRAGTRALRTYPRIMGGAFQIFNSGVKVEYLCSVCSFCVVSGAAVDENVIVVCPKCGTHNVTEPITMQWGIPYSDDLPAPIDIDPRAIWMASS